MMQNKIVKSLFLSLLFILLTACNSNVNDKSSKSSTLTQTEQELSSQLPNPVLAKKFIDSKVQKTDASDVASITSEPITLLYAYYTANSKTSEGLLRWYISATGGSLVGYIFSLGEIETINGEEKVSWREVSSDAASVNLVTEQVVVGNIADNPSHTFKDWGLGVDKNYESIQEDIELIRNTTVNVRWWFFQAPNDAWYIIDKQNHIYKFETKNGEYDWQDVNTTSFQLEFYMENGQKKLKLPDSLVAPKKTGQTTSYDAVGNVVADGSLKDDGYYQKGTTPSYTRDDVNETVTDNVTGLMWQDDAAVASVQKQWLTDDNYNTCSNDKTDPACFDTTGDTATTYCSELVMGGYDDWRLPTSVELEGIVNYGVSNPSIDSTFQNSASSSYWSSSSIVGDEDYAWFVYFYYGGVYGDDKDYNRYVRCVRDGQ